MRAAGVLRISAGNYGGKLGPYHFHLRELAAGYRRRARMRTITLRVRTAPGFRVDGSKLLPAPLAALSADRIRATRATRGQHDLRSSATFRRDAFRQRIAELRRGRRRRGWLDRLGAHLAEGRMDVHGPAGAYAGLGMIRRRIAHRGRRRPLHRLRDARRTAHRHGNAGDFAAGALPGDMEGMTGGTLTIHGNAGARLADRMRRGLVLVGGDAGDFAASRIVAGTVCIAGRIGTHYAYGMRRGTLLLAREPDRLPPTFTGRRTWLSCLLVAFCALACSRDRAVFGIGRNALPRRHAGDLAVDGRGELLIAQS